MNAISELCYQDLGQSLFGGRATGGEIGGQEGRQETKAFCEVDGFV